MLPLISLSRGFSFATALRAELQDRSSVDDPPVERIDLATFLLRSARACSALHAPRIPSARSRRRWRVSTREHVDQRRHARIAFAKRELANDGRRVPTAVR